MVGYYWQKWYGLGLVVNSDRRKGRMQKIVSLDEVGLTVASGLEKTVEGTEVEFRPNDLKRILNDQRIFLDNFQIEDFAFSILSRPLRDLKVVTREELIDIVINTFETSDRIKQNLFMQALERRALERQSSSEFSKFFEAWVRQIGK
jgi:hypothetical protein